MAHEPLHNRRLTAVLLGGAVLVPLVLALLVGLVLGLVLPLAILGLLAGAGVAAAAWFASTASVLRRVGAGAPPAGEGAARNAGAQRLENLVEGLCMASGLPQPHLRVVDDPAPDALAAGVRPGDATIVVTSGLLDTLGRVELEGVVGHLLARIRRGDVVPATLAAFLLGPLAPRLVRPDRAEADALAVATTRYPPGLAAALTKLRDDPRAVARAPRASLTLWVVPPAARADDPEIDHRIAVLREL